MKYMHRACALIKVIPSSQIDPQEDDMIELRCGGTMHGRMDGFLLEVKCGRRSCGVKPGVVVLHTFDVMTGNLVGTKRFKDPIKKKGSSNGSSGTRATVRNSGYQAQATRRSG